ncbi:MAG: hypothetical protein ABSE56_02465 [Bryobacteraceae bacterium]|jgi:hypothetical protein
MQQGPIKPLDPADYDLIVDPPEFADAVAADLAALDPEDQVHAEVSAALVELAATPVEELLGSGLDDAAAELDFQSGSTGELDLSAANSAADVADQQIIDTYSEIPGEAWLPLPDFTENMPNENYWGPPAPTSGPVNPPPWQPSAPVYLVVLENLTTPKPDNPQTGQVFHVGDQWRVTVQGPLNSTVSLYGSQNGAYFSNADMGGTGFSGYVLLQGSMTHAELGHWTEEWLVAGVPCEPGTLEFDVVP